MLLFVAVLRRNPSPTLPRFDYQPHQGGLRSGIDDRRLNELIWNIEEDVISPGSAD